MMYVFSMALAIFSSVIYHLVTRSIAPAAHPLVSITITYITAMLLALILLPFFPLKVSLGESLRQLNWASVGMGVAILGIEISFLLAYRARWNISLAALVTNAAVTVVLLPVGVLAFKERISAEQIAGLLLCVIGLVLINKR